jgi:4'-phosphopantetheinyl transferase
MSDAPGYQRFSAGSRLARVGPGLSESEIHVWRAGLDVTSDRLVQFEETLAPDERERIGRLRAAIDRRRATVSRGALRHILAGYVGVPAAEIRFTYSPAGKPELSGTASGNVLHFNTAHSGDLLLVALGRVPSLGIDVESIRPIVRWERVARRTFSVDERREIEALPAEDREEAFITCWTRKEACVKAIGEGIWSAFARFEVSVTPARPAELLSVDGEPSAAAGWSLYHLEPEAGFVGALAVQDDGRRSWDGTIQRLEART